MAFPTPSVVTYEHMIFVLCRQRLLIYQKLDDIVKKIFIQATFSSQFKIPLVLGRDT